MNKTKRFLVVLLYTSCAGAITAIYMLCSWPSIMKFKILVSHMYIAFFACVLGLKMILAC